MSKKHQKRTASRVPAQPVPHPSTFHLILMVAMVAIVAIIALLIISKP